MPRKTDSARTSSRAGEACFVPPLCSHPATHTKAEDLVQTVLLRMYVSWHRIRSDTRDAYARKILVNAGIDEQRRPYARHEQNHAQVPDVAVEASPPSDAEAAVFRALPSGEPVKVDEFDGVVTPGPPAENPLVRGRHRPLRPDPGLRPPWNLRSPRNVR